MEFDQLGWTDLVLAVWALLAPVLLCLGAGINVRTLKDHSTAAPSRAVLK